MIRDFHRGDEHKFKPNEFSTFEDLGDLFETDEYTKYTLDIDGDINCILCWKEYEPDHYAIFFLMPDGFDVKYSRVIKEFLDGETERLKPKSCITYSFNCDMLNRWHKFFGFVLCEGEEVEVNGKTFNKWIIRWDGK